MAELSLHGGRLSFGGDPLLDGVDLQIETGERIGLLGRNGAGKSTLLKVLCGELTLDAGKVSTRNGLTIAGLQQDVPEDLAGTVGEQFAQAFGAQPEDANAEWEMERRIEQVLEAMQLDRDEEVANLSAGKKRRVLLGRALVVDPDVLVLDEPTNHLDLAVIESLEVLLKRRRGALIFVTHDRGFLRTLANRILDLDRGVLRSYDCSYEKYLERKSAELESEAREQAVFDKKLAQEEVWIRKGVLARRTRNQGRVRALKAMREERRARRDRIGTVKANVQVADRTGDQVLVLENVTHGFDGEPLIRDLSLRVQRGDRIGILGPNGCGKTTLLKLLLGELEPQSGTIKRGTKLEVARFDQLHSGLDNSKTVRENICDKGDMVTVNGKSRHIVGYLQDFLFSPDRSLGSIVKLSGGERNRLQLAQILVRPCNFLILDEPTNDLDLETLDLLEELLVDFPGTLLVVSHDREFLDNAVTSVLAFEGNGVVTESVGGYTDWLEKRAAKQPKLEPKTKQKAKANKSSQSVSPSKPQESKGSTGRRLNYNEKRELEGLPERLEKLEADKQAVLNKMADPDFYRKAGPEMATTQAELTRLEQELVEAYARWEDLETIAGG